MFSTFRGFKALDEPGAGGNILGCKPPCKADPDTPLARTALGPDRCGARGYPIPPCMGVYSLDEVHFLRREDPRECLKCGNIVGCKPPCKDVSDTPWARVTLGPTLRGTGGYPHPCG